MQSSKVRTVFSALLAGMLFLSSGVSTAYAEDPTVDGQSSDNEVLQQSWTPPQDSVIHDNLTDDSAKITDVNTVSKTTGTAPFDKDDNPGDDSRVDNSIVRSYDSLNYTISYTMASKNTKDYYKDARIKFKFSMPFETSVAEFSVKEMLWMDTTTGYTYKIGYETVNGVKYQTLTCWRHINGTKDNPTVVPGMATINLPINVYGASNGTKIQPTVQVSMEHNTDSEAVTKQLETVTVSAAPRWNIELASLKRIQSGTYDFGESEDGDAINKTAGKVTGVLSHLTINVANTSTDHAKGIKGLEATNEPVTFDVKISNQWRRQGASTPIANQPNSLQPLAWSIANGSLNRLAIFHKYPSDRSNTKEADTFNSQKKNDYASEWKMTQETKNGYIILHLTVSHLDQRYNPNSKDQQNGILNWASAGIDLVNPTKINNKNLADQYGSDLNLQQDVWDMNLQASSVSGIKAKSAPSDSSNQSIISDDETGASIPLYVSGMNSNYNQSIEYGCAGWKWQDSQTRDSSCILFQQEGSSVHDGSDIAVRGQKVMLASRISYSQNKTNLPVIRTRLMKIDSTVLEPYENASTWNRPAYGDGKNIFSESTLAYGVKKDGKAWSSDTEQAKAGISDLNYYNSISEAKKHGEIVAILATSYNAAPYGSTWMEGNEGIGRDFFGLDVQVKTGREIINKTAQYTVQSLMWTRKDLAAKAGLDADNASNKDWVNWISKNKLDPAELVKQVAPTGRVDSTPYQKAKWDDVQGYVGGDTADRHYGDSLHIVAEIAQVSKSTDQSDGDKGSKQTYDIDNGQRYVDWKLDLNMASNPYGRDTVDTKTDMTVTDTLPSKLHYLPSTAYLGGDYKENTPSQGNVDNGARIEPNATLNADGTTTLVWHLDNIDTSKQYTIHYSTSIGDATDPDNDVVNAEQLTNKVSVSTYRSPVRPKMDLTHSEYTIKISRLKLTTLAIKADPLVNEVNAALHWKSIKTNNLETPLSNPIATAIMPNNSNKLSNYQGTWTLSGITVSGRNGSQLGDGHLVYTTDSKYLTADPSTIKPDEVKGWKSLQLNTQTGVATIPSNLCPTAWAWVGDKPLAGGASVIFDITIQPANNRPANLYEVRWGDGFNKTDADTTVVQRVVSGIAWYDKNGNGIREDDDALASHVTVTVTDSNGKTVSGYDGNPLTAVTGKDGTYRIVGIPAGTGYQVRFAPDKRDSWIKLKTTVKNATGSTKATNSGADPVSDSTGLKGAYIQLADFPSPSQMAGPVYEDVYENCGIVRTVMPYFESPITSMPFTGGWLLPVLLVVSSGSLVGAIVLLRPRKKSSKN